jgi:protein pelota
LWHLQLGAYHTLDIELNRSFELLKNCWDAVVIDRLEQACDPAQHVSIFLA